MCTGVEIALIGAAIAGTATTAVAISESHQAGKAAQSAAETAANTQAQQFQQQLDAFTALTATAPVPEVIMDEALEEAQQKKSLYAQTILTSPSGLLVEPNIAVKTLLGS